MFPLGGEYGVYSRLRAAASGWRWRLLNPPRTVVIILIALPQQSTTADPVRNKLPIVCSRPDAEFIQLYDDVMLAVGPDAAALIVEPSLKIGRNRHTVERYALSCTMPITGADSAALAEAFQRFSKPLAAMHAPDVAYQWLLDNVDKEPKVVYACDFSGNQPAYKLYLGTPPRSRFRTPYGGRLGAPVTHSPLLLSLEWEADTGKTAYREYNQICIPAADDLNRLLAEFWLAEHDGAREIAASLRCILEGQWCKEAAIIQFRGTEPAKLLFSLSCKCAAHKGRSLKPLEEMRSSLLQVAIACGFDCASLETWFQLVREYPISWLGIDKKPPLGLSIYYRLE